MLSPTKVVGLDKRQKKTTLFNKCIQTDKQYIIVVLRDKFDDKLCFRLPILFLSYSTFLIF